MKFTGHERDLASAAGDRDDDLDYMHARHASPLDGPVSSFDPIGGNPSAPQSWNRYAYVLNRPLNYVDPYGCSEHQCKATRPSRRRASMTQSTSPLTG